MSVALKWKGTALMFGPFALAEVMEATRFTSRYAGYQIAGHMAEHIGPLATMEKTNAAARHAAERAVIEGLKAAGIDAEVAS